MFVWCGQPCNVEIMAIESIRDIGALKNLPQGFLTQPSLSGDMNLGHDSVDCSGYPTSIADFL